jgi:DNA adenine methylase
MKYMGSKSRIAKDIIPIMLKHKSPEQCWVEPFVGGANIIEKIEGQRIGADSNRYTIEALISIRDYVEELPKNNEEFTEVDYKQLRNNDNYKYKGYAGFALSYGGKWLGGWRRDSSNKRDYVDEAYRNAIKQSVMIQNVKFIHSNYDKLIIPPESFIYCDPPYAETTKYNTKFNHEEFWQWCRQKSSEGHIIYVSEYSAPDDFKCVWQKEICSSLTKNTGNKKGMEKLFVYENRAGR